MICSIMLKLVDHADILVESEIRQRRPVFRNDPVIDEVESNAEVERTENQSKNSMLAQTTIRHYLNSVRTSFTVSLLKPYRIETVGH